MDMKASSVTKEKNFDDDHRKFLEITKIKETFVKMVISKEIDLGEFENHIQIVKEVAPTVPVVLMPISTQVEGHEDHELMQLIQQLQQKASEQISSVRIVPRFHKILNIR